MAWPSLSQFLIQAPGLGQTASLEQLAQALASSSHDYAVVLTPQRSPLGLVRAARLLTQLVAQPTEPLDAALADYPSWLEPIALVAVDAPLESLFLKGAGLPGSPCAVVNEQQVYLGLLDWKQLLPLLAERFISLPSSSDATWQSWSSYSAAVLPVQATTTLEAGPPLVAPPAARYPPDPRSAWLLELNHELKSPLTSLLGLSALLQDPRLGELSARQARYARLMHQTTRQLATTINQLLDWFRLESGQLVLLPGPINLVELCGQLSRFAGAQLQAPPDDLSRDQTRAAQDRAGPPPFSWQIAPGLTSVVADLLRLRQILHHLISYGVSQMAPVTACGLDVERWAGWIALTVWYKGSRLSQPAKLQLLQQHSGRETAELPVERHDLGLILTGRLVRLHGGEISTCSTAVGGRLTVLLPDSRAGDTIEAQALWLAQSKMDDAAGSPEVGSACPPAVPAASTVLLLLACLNETITEAVIDSLEQTHFRVAIARTGPELVSKAQRLQPALILVHTETAWPAECALIDRPWIALDNPAIAAEPAQPTSLAASPISRLTTATMNQQLLPQLQAALAAGVTAPPRSLTELTLLHLGELPTGAIDASPAWSLHGWLHTCQCRVLEVDDLAQAEVLCRVWKPDVVVLDPTIVEPEQCLARLAQLPSLSRRPLITLTPALTAAAQRFPKLAVFPFAEALSLEAEVATARLIDLVLRAANQSC